MKLHVIIISAALLATVARAQRMDLDSVKSWAYQLQECDPSTIASDSSFRLIVMDYSRDGTQETQYSPAEIATIRSSGKLVIAYLSIGEAEDYRFYWMPEWKTDPPSWLGPQNPDWPGNYKVRFWEASWKSIVYSYLDTILAQGFDGVYLDVVDAFTYWMEDNPEQPIADTLMVDFIRALRHRIDAHATGAFYIIPQNPDDLIHALNITPALRQAFYDAIDAIGVEDIYFPGDLDENNPWNPDDKRLSNLREIRNAGNVIFSVEYLTDRQKIDEYVREAGKEDFIPYVCTRELDMLCHVITTSTGHRVTTLPRTFTLRVIPHPLRSEGILYVQSPHQGSIIVDLFDAIGHRIRRLHTAAMQQRSIALPIDAGSLPAGLYYLRAWGSRATATLPVVISR